VATGCLPCSPCISPLTTRLIPLTSPLHRPVYGIYHLVMYINPHAGIYTDAVRGVAGALDPAGTSACRHACGALAIQLAGKLADARRSEAPRTTSMGAPWVGAVTMTIADDTTPATRPTRQGSPAVRSQDRRAARTGPENTASRRGTLSTSSPPLHPSMDPPTIGRRAGTSPTTHATNARTTPDPQDQADNQPPRTRTLPATMNTPEQPDEAKGTQKGTRGAQTGATEGRRGRRRRRLPRSARARARARPEPRCGREAKDAEGGCLQGSLRKDLQGGLRRRGREESRRRPLDLPARQVRKKVA
jgi:hypothetical protein